MNQTTERKPVTTKALKELVTTMIGVFIAGLLSRMYNVKAEGSAEERIRHIASVLELRHWNNVQRELEVYQERTIRAVNDTMRTAICEGMNIECGSVTLADLFACVDTSITKRITKALQYRNMAQDHSMGERDWKADCEELEAMIENAFGVSGSLDGDGGNSFAISCLTNDYNAYKNARKATSTTIAKEDA